MKVLFSVVRTLGFLITVLLAPITYANGWELVFESEDLVVQWRDYKGSELKEIKGVTRVNASLSLPLHVTAAPGFLRGAHD